MTYAALEQRFGGIVHNQGFSVVVDVSRCGMLVRTPERPRRNTVLTIRAAAGDQIHTLRSRIVRIEPSTDGVFEIALEYCYTGQHLIDGFVDALDQHDRPITALAG